MIYRFLIVGFLLFSNKLSSQEYNSNQASISNYVKRVYSIEKFDGIKILENDADKFLVIAVKLEKKNNLLQILNTIANVKAKAYYSSFQNGSYIIAETIIVTANNDSLQKTPISSEILKEYSSGFVKGLSMLTNFDDTDPKYIVYIFYTKL